MLRHWRALIGRDAHLMLEVVAKAAHQCFLGYVVADLGQDLRQVRVILRYAVARHVHEGLERASFLCLDRTTLIVERPPVGEFLHVLRKIRRGLVW